MNWLPNIPGFIIEKLRELERIRKQEQQRPHLEAPPPLPPLPPEVDEDPQEEEHRGPVIIDMNTYEIINEDN